jgi:hypothetical protein
MIVGTHRLYSSTTEALFQQVVEIEEGIVTKNYPFESELHSMVWYDAVILSHSHFEKCFFSTMEEALAFAASVSSVTHPCHAYGVTFHENGCLLEPLY